MPNKVLFSVNSYDRDGDVYETGIFLHFGDTRILVAETVTDFKTFIDGLTGMIQEMTEDFRRHNNGR